LQLDEGSLPSISTKLHPKGECTGFTRPYIVLSTYGVELKLGDEMIRQGHGIRLQVRNDKNTIKSLAAAAMANASMKETSADIIEFAAA
jgi:hypothetical protein